MEPFSDFDTAALQGYLRALRVCGLGKDSARKAAGALSLQAALSSSLSDFSVLPKRPCQQQTKLKSQGGGKFSEESLESGGPGLIDWLWHVLSVWPWACQLTSPGLFALQRSESRNTCLAKGR